MPQYLNNLIGGITNQIYLIVNVIQVGTLGGGGSLGIDSTLLEVDVIVGRAVLQRFLCVFHPANGQVGFAYAPLTYVNINLIT